MGVPLQPPAVGRGARADGVVIGAGIHEDACGEAGRERVRRRGGLLGRLHLGVVEAGVGAVGGEQFVVRAHLHDPARVEHDEPVGPPERREPVGDGDRGASGHEPVDGRLDDRLRLRVDARGGLVEHQDPRIDEQRPGDREPLPFAAGERAAALADPRVVGRAAGRG